jgi:hypothetical protein
MYEAPHYAVFNWNISGIMNEISWKSSTDFELLQLDKYPWESFLQIFIAYRQKKNSEKSDSLKSAWVNHSVSVCHAWDKWLSEKIKKKDYLQVGEYSVRYPYTLWSQKIFCVRVQLYLGFCAVVNDAHSQLIPEERRLHCMTDSC